VVIGRSVHEQYHHVKTFTGFSIALTCLRDCARNLRGRAVESAPLERVCLPSCAQKRAIGRTDQGRLLDYLMGRNAVSCEDLGNGEIGMRTENMRGKAWFVILKGWKLTGGGLTIRHIYRDRGITVNS
jgi:hypothetical protein